VVWPLTLTTMVAVAPSVVTTKALVTMNSISALSSSPSSGRTRRNVRVDVGAGDLLPPTVTLIRRGLAKGEHRYFPEVVGLAGYPDQRGSLSNQSSWLAHHYSPSTWAFSHELQNAPRGSSRSIRRMKSGMRS
jgi:hypothetical protein